MHFLTFLTFLYLFLTVENQAILISVIVPVYHAEPWIERCVRSLMEQTAEALEIIFVDDCGTDASIGIIRRVVAEYAGRQHQVTIITNPCHVGPGPSRLAGVEHCHGKYVTFVDADDWVDHDMLRQMCMKAEVVGADMVYCSVTEHSIDGSIVVRPSQAYATESDMVTDLFCNFCYNTAMWSKLIRRELLLDRNLNWPRTSTHEDVLTSFQLWMTSFSRCSYIDHPFYHYNRHEGSVSQPMTDARHEEFIINHDNACVSVVQVLRKMGKIKAYAPTLLKRRLTALDSWAEFHPKIFFSSPRMRRLVMAVCWATITSGLTWRFKIGFIRRIIGRVAESLMAA